MLIVTLIARGHGIHIRQRRQWKMRNSRQKKRDMDDTYPVTVFMILCDSLKTMSKVDHQRAYVKTSEI